MTQSDVWYYFDANILILLNNNGLIETLKQFKEKKMAKLLITNEINKELQGKPKEESTRNHDISKINNIIQGGILDIIDPSNLNRTDADYLKLSKHDVGKRACCKQLSKEVKSIQK